MLVIQKPKIWYLDMFWPMKFQTSLIFKSQMYTIVWQTLNNDFSISVLDEVGHHRHWQAALSKIAGMKIYTLPFKLPDVGSVLGGVLELRGRHISLACFHGINFKSKSWALFSLKDPSISFVSDAQEIMEERPGIDRQSPIFLFPN